MSGGLGMGDNHFGRFCLPLFIHFIPPSPTTIPSPDTKNKDFSPLTVSGKVIIYIYTFSSK
jgi:hypothetical protein